MAEDKTLKTVPPITHPNDVEHRRLIAQAVSLLMDGKANNTGEITLTDGTDTTVLDNKRLGPKSTVQLIPLTANADAIGWYISARDNDQVTFTHDNTANTDQDFAYVIFGS